MPYEEVTYHMDCPLLPMRGKEKVVRELAIYRYGKETVWLKCLKIFRYRNGS
jgi:hypothetical protein